MHMHSTRRLAEGGISREAAPPPRKPAGNRSSGPGAWRWLGHSPGHTECTVLPGRGGDPSS
eukprot:scaffold18474_cov61-Phaeocystis_antarctica.AAC.2